MKVQYTPSFFDDYSAVEYSPRLRVIFLHPTIKREIWLFGLVDSGAAETILHIKMAKLLGIDDVASGEKVLYTGIGGEVEGYRHPLHMQVVGDRKKDEVMCAFAEIADIDCLLGQRGFFENYKVIFEKYKNQFEVIAK